MIRMIMAIKMMKKSIIRINLKIIKDKNDKK